MTVKMPAAVVKGEMSAKLDDLFQSSPCFLIKNFNRYLKFDTRKEEICCFILFQRKNQGLCSKETIMSFFFFVFFYIKMTKQN